MIADRFRNRKEATTRQRPVAWQQLDADYVIEDAAGTAAAAAGAATARHCDKHRQRETPERTHGVHEAADSRAGERLCRSQLPDEAATLRNCSCVGSYRKTGTSLTVYARLRCFFIN